MESKVRIEYADPSNVYPRFASGLSSRLPLRELHWSSSSRPIRSISSLLIDFVPADGVTSKPEPTLTERFPEAQDNVPPPKTDGDKKERRHQIPGLRPTPYLKIYLLFCNDVDTYRASSRKQLREWVKGNTPQSLSSASFSKQENHDAFEWLIIHVVPQATGGLTDKSQPSSNKGDSSAEKRPISSRWPSRNSMSVIEKLRSDFNGTSKTAIDRVAQIQLVEPRTDGARQADLRIDDEKQGWGDLVFKLKSLILASFDLRVSQYEEDIKEREEQKKVFGWNFNTFFVLKEGLAMGFENMGLLEDALKVYQELAFELKAIIEEQQHEGSEQQTAHFVDFTEDMYRAFKHAKELNVNQDDNDHDARKRTNNPGAFILNTERKPYRELILSNKVSCFDFQCYVFARQVSISLRLANVINTKLHSKRASASPDDTEYEGVGPGDDEYLEKSTDVDPENMIILAEVVRSSIDFITSTAHAVREDIRKAVGQSQAGLPGEGTSRIVNHEEAIDNFVKSWLFSACECMLEATSTRSLTAQLDPLLRQLLPTSSDGTDNGHDYQATQNHKVAPRNGLPARTSSLPPFSPVKPLEPLEMFLPSLNCLDASRLSIPGNPRPGAQDLASERGEIYALKRRVLIDLGLRHGNWQGRLADLDSASASAMNVDEMEDVKLDQDILEDAAGTPSNFVGADPTVAGLCNETLLSALHSDSDFYKEYESLTIAALAHCAVGDRKKTAEAMTADLAVARFQQQDYLAAASYFRQLAPFYAKDDWSDLEVTMLDTYAQCLRNLGKIEEYVRIKLKTVAKIINRQHWRFLDSTAASLNDLIDASKTLDVEVSAPMDDFFHEVHLSKYISHFADRDGFKLSLKLQSLLPEDLQVQSVQVLIVCTEDDQRYELWLSTESPHIIERGRGEITLVSNLMQYGWYTLDKIHVLSSNIRFTLDLSPTVETTLFPRKRESASASALKPLDFTYRQRLLIWPRPESLDVRLTHCENITLEQPNSIWLAISAGWNDVIKCKLSIRSASAGLRLHTAGAEILGGNCTILGKPQPGSITINELSANARVGIKVPYSVETDPREISVRAMVDYTTKFGEYAFSCSARLSILLPLAINVQDTFRQATLVSKFTVGPSTPVPVRISSCHLEGNRDFRVVAPTLPITPVTTFPRQPLSLVSKIHRVSGREYPSDQAQKKMLLKVEYNCLDEEIRAALNAVLLGDLATTSLQAFSRALSRSLILASHALIARQDLEVIGTRRQIHIGPFEEWPWDVLLAGFSPEHEAKLSNWLRGWHERNQTIFLDRGGVTPPQQHLTVPVEIPQMAVVQTARLRRLAKSSLTTTDSTTVPIGRGLPMQLSVSHTQSWNPAKASTTADTALQFRYEMQANPDIWLIGGQRKGHFSAKEAEVRDFSLLLWPQKTGHLPLPSLETQLLASAQHESDGEEASAERVRSCELDYQSSSDTILVVPDRISTTVSLDPSGSGGGWLVESRSRSP